MPARKPATPAPAKKHAGGRPRTIDHAATKAAILDAMTEGVSVKRACTEAGVSWRYVCDWLVQDAEFAARYARAREASADVWAERAVDAATMATPETVQVDRLRHDAYKWRARVSAPRVYGEKQQIEHAGEIRQFIAEVPPRAADGVQWATAYAPPGTQG